MDKNARVLNSIVFSDKHAWFTPLSLTEDCDDLFFNNDKWLDDTKKTCQ